MATTKMPTTTSHESRLQIFQPTRRPQRMTREFTNAWGRVRITGRLGQAHCDVLQAIRYCAQRHDETGDGRIKLLVDPAAVRRTARQMSGSTLRTIIDDLLGAVVQIIEPTELACTGHLIDHIDEARRKDNTPVTRENPLTGGERAMWRVDVGLAGMRLLEADFGLYYNPAPIAGLQHGISQAVTRHVLTHTQQPSGGWKLDGLIEAVAGGCDSTALRHRRRELRTDAAALAEMGIAIDGDRVRCVA